MVCGIWVSEALQFTDTSVCTLCCGFQTFATHRLYGSYTAFRNLRFTDRSLSFSLTPLFANASLHRYSTLRGLYNDHLFPGYLANASYCTKRPGWTHAFLERGDAVMEDGPFSGLN